VSHRRQRPASVISGEGEAPPEAPRELDRSFRRGFAATFLLDLVAKAISAATVVVLIRGLGVSDYAFITLFLTVAQFTAGAASGGVRTRYLREEAEHVSRGERSGQSRFFISLVNQTLLVLLVGALAALVAQLVGFGVRGGDIELVLYATAFALGSSASDLAIAHHEARRRFVLAGVLNSLRAFVILVVSLLVTAEGVGAPGLALWFVGGLVLVGAATVAPIVRRRSGMPMERAIPLALTREDRWLSLYYVAAAGFAYVDVLVAGALLDDEEVATLGASVRYLGLILSAMPALGVILRVRTSQVDIVDSPTNQRQLLIGWMRRSALPAVVFVVAGIFLAPLVIPRIDGGQYPDSVVVLQIFLALALAAYVTAPASSVVMAQRRYATLALLYLGALLVNFLGDVAVAPHFGIIGIAIVSATVYVTLDVFVSVSALKTTAAHDARAAAKLRARET
jgi:O-antigen/teichoic acid export membrane protein